MPTPDDQAAGASSPAEPYIPASQSPAEITLKAVILGIVLSVLLAGANAYLGLKAGMTVSASIPAAVISMAILRLFKRSNILENNIVQTAASAGESLAAGVIFTLPALVLLRAWTDFNYLETTIIAALGGVIGVLFTIPLRRALIVDSPLKFPEGVATAEVLKAGEGGSGIAAIAAGGIIGMIVKFGEVGVRLWTGVLEGGTRIGSSIFYYGTNASPALLAVGYIVGINIAVLVFLGGALNWYGAIPIVAAGTDWPVYQIEERAEDPDAWDVVTVDADVLDGWSEAEIAELQASIAAAREDGLNDEQIIDRIFADFAIPWSEIDEADAETALNDRREALDEFEKIGRPVDADEWANQIWSERTRYLGVGAMAVGGLWALLRMAGNLVRGIRASLRAYQSMRGGEGGGLRRTERDTPMQWVGIALVISIIPLFFVFNHITDNVAISAFMAVVMLIAGFLFSAVASYMAGLVGSSNNPISGVTIATLLTASLLLLALGMDSASGPAAAILIGAVVCCAAAIGGDNMQDLKAGHIVGATPYKQQIMQGIGVLAAALVMAPILSALLRAYGIGDLTVEGQEPLEAPQATLMQSVAQGVFTQSLPWDIVAIGAGIAVIVIVIDLILEATGSAFRAPVLAVAVGVYLPLELSVPILFGGLISWLANVLFRRRQGGETGGAAPLGAPDEGESPRAAQLRSARSIDLRNGLLFAAGLITGEAILGILLAIPLAIWEGENRIADGLAAVTGMKEEATWPGGLLLAAIMVVLYLVATRAVRRVR
ncbi:MAG: oligopeptide transporter, OPT family [Planctomycetota bacterium]|nr:oligopeptide transporter, OPT family [Planctomycetota bacterium]